MYGLCWKLHLFNWELNQMCCLLVQFIGLLLFWIPHLLCVLVKWAILVSCSDFTCTWKQHCTASPRLEPGYNDLNSMYIHLVAYNSPSFPHWEDAINFTKSGAYWFLKNLNHELFVSNFSTVGSTNYFPVHSPCGVFRVCTSHSIACNILRDYTSKLLLWSVQTACLHHYLVICFFAQQSIFTFFYFIFKEKVQEGLYAAHEFSVEVCFISRLQIYKALYMCFILLASVVIWFLRWLFVRWSSVFARCTNLKWFS